MKVWGVTIDKYLYSDQTGLYSYDVKLFSTGVKAFAWYNENKSKELEKCNFIYSPEEMEVE
jgi:hypothetical protein